MIRSDEKLSTFKNYLKKAKTSNSSTIFISGETGVGKTGLLEAFKDISTDEGVPVYSGTPDMDSGRPFEVLSKAMGNLLDKPLFEEHDYTSFVKIFAIDKGGMLVAQASSEDEEMDADIFAGMLSAVQNFVSDSLGKEGDERTGLGRLEYGDMKILIEHGTHLFLTGVFTGVEHPDMKSGLNQTLRKIEEEHGSTLEDWSGRVSEVEGVFNPYQFTGRRYDNETGQYYYRARMYSSVQGRFLSADSLGMVDGPNMYMYVRNDPINARDPSGKWNPDWGAPMLINGWGGGGSLDCPYGSYPTFSECYRAYRETGFSRRESLAYCLGDCTNPDPTPPGDGWGGIDWGARTRFEVRRTGWLVYGYKFEFDAVASESIGSGLSWSGPVVCASICTENVIAIPACIAIIAFGSIFSYCAAQGKGTRINWNIVSGLIDSHRCIENF